MIWPPKPGASLEERAAWYKARDERRAKAVEAGAKRQAELIDLIVEKVLVRIADGELDDIKRRAIMGLDGAARSITGGEPSAACVEQKLLDVVRSDLPQDLQNGDQNAPLGGDLGGEVGPIGHGAGRSGESHPAGSAAQPEAALTAPQTLAAVSALAAEVQALSAKAHALELLLKGPDLAVKLLHVDVDVLTTAGAPELSLRAEPTDLALRLLAAVRAGNADLLIVEEALGHLISSGVCCDDATVRRVGGAGKPRPAGEPPAAQREAAQ